MRNIILMKNREPTHAELNSLTEQRDRLVIETICRALGTRDFALAEVYPRGKWTEYVDGELLFEFDGKEKLLVGPPVLDRSTNKYVQKIEYLYDKNDFIYQPVEVQDPDEELDDE